MSTLKLENKPPKTKKRAISSRKFFKDSSSQKQIGLPLSRSVQTLFERKRARASEKPFILLRSKREDGPFAAHATARCIRENFLCENRTRSGKKKVQKNWREREIDFGLRVPVSFKDSLSLFLSSGSGNKNKKHGRVRCVYRVVVFLLRSFLFGSRKIVRSSRGEGSENQKRGF